MPTFVIVCAEKKNGPEASFIDHRDRFIRFVADPEKAPDSLKLAGKRQQICVKPEVNSGDGTTWRQFLKKYNTEQRRQNPLRFQKAFQLYQGRGYQALVDGFGEKNTFILSAAWGMLPADYLIPHYDVTFSSSAKKVKPFAYCDFQSWDTRDLLLLPETAEKPICFLGGKDYHKAFMQLTPHCSTRSDRILFLFSENSAINPECQTIHYPHANPRRWYHYCAEELAAKENLYAKIFTK